MKNIKFYIEPETQEKILHKHGIRVRELRIALKDPRRKIRRMRDNIYMAVTHYARYITVFFEYEQNRGRIITAYPSQDWQIQMYNRQ